MTDLHLTPDDQRGFADALRALLAPLDYADVDAWRGAVCGRLRPLFGADMAMFLLPVGGRSDAFSAEYPPLVRTYPEVVKPVAEAFDMCARIRALGVADRPMLWGEHLEAFYQSVYWNEFTRPHRAHDALTLGVQVGPEARLAHQAHVIFHHDSPHKQPFGDRGLALGRLLLPALQAGALTWLRLQDARCAFAVEVEALDVALFLFDTEGRELYRNAALRALLGSAPGTESGTESLVALARNLARSAGRLALQTRFDVGDGVSRAVEGVVKAGGARYELRASHVGSAVTGCSDAVAVTVERRAAVLPSEEALCERWGLTKQQARVALLLADRKTNPEVAEALTISPHTARHHTEAVLAKLGVSDRRDVSERISS